MEAVQSMLSVSGDNASPSILALPIPSGHSGMSMVTMQSRGRSLGSVVDDGMSVDQSMLAHDGSRDGSVVPEHSPETLTVDEEEAAEIVAVDPGTSSVADTDRMTMTDHQDLKTIHSGDASVSAVSQSGVNVDAIHHEAHEIIDELHGKLNALQAEQQHGRTAATALDFDHDILGPLIQRQNEERIHGHDHGHDHHHEHGDRDKKEMLSHAKVRWNGKMEEMIANTDQWYINQDGDIVLIYPENDDGNGDTAQNGIVAAGGGDAGAVRDEQGVRAHVIREEHRVTDTSNHGNCDGDTVATENGLCRIEDDEEDNAPDLAQDEECHIHQSTEKRHNDSDGQVDPQNDSIDANEAQTDNSHKPETFFSSFRIF